MIIVGQLTTDRDQMALAYEREEGRLAIESQIMERPSKEEIKFSKGVLHTLRSKINLLCDADRDIPARYYYTIEQIERAML